MANFFDAITGGAKVLKDLAEGNVTEPVGRDKSASADANERARRNPSGIDMAAEAQKAAARAGVKPPAPGLPAIAPGTAKRDHYKPRR